MADRTSDLYFTAYPSDSRGGWTVWDHVDDVPVVSGVSEAEAVQRAAELQDQHG